jgi:hypothetical protein
MSASIFSIKRSLLTATAIRHHGIANSNKSIAQGVGNACDTLKLLSK